MKNVMQNFSCRIMALLFLLGFPAVLIAQTSAESPESSPLGKAVVTSPDGRVEITFHTLSEGQTAPTGGRLVYSVSFQGKPMIEPSAISLELEDGFPLGQNVRMVSLFPSGADETYTLVTGKTRTVRNHYNALRIDLIDNASAGRLLTIEARAYDDAAAFRYRLPEQKALSSVRLKKENTEFRISKDPFIYALVLPHYRSMYESEFLKLSASSLSNQGGVSSTVLLGLPLLMEVSGRGWMAITEADMQGSAAMYLVNPSGGWTSHKFESRLAPRLDSPDVAVIGQLPYTSPWRVMLIGSEPGRLIESNVITSLNPPSVIEDTSWIRAGRASWDWWNGSLGPDGQKAFTTETMKFYVDFAAASGFEYTLVDAGWSRRDITRMNGTVDIPELVKYAAAKNVKIWIWLPYDATTRQMDEAFALYEKWGVAGLKIDFVERDDQEGIEFYYRAAKKAARHHLMVDFHGSTKPTGMDRTYPNVMGYEAVLGMEQSKAGSRDNTDSHVMLPFTRMLTGPMDYTPGGFDNVTPGAFEPRMERPMVMGTRAHHLAMYVVYDAPFQMVADHPSAYQGQPAFQFIRDVPATWNQTKVLNGQPGEYITIARRSGDSWFLGSMTGRHGCRLEIPLDFLGEGRYTADIYADAPDADQFPKKCEIEKKMLMRTERLTLKLAPDGGCAIRFRPEK